MIAQLNNCNITSAKNVIPAAFICLIDSKRPAKDQNPNEMMRKC